MSRKNREAAPPFQSWRGIPKELPPQLYQVSFNARVVALELYRHAPNYDGRIDVIGAWDVALCRLMGVDSIARANVCRIFRKLQEAGALHVFDSFVIVWVGQSLDGLPTQTTVATQQPLDSHSIAGGGPLDSRRGATEGPLASRPKSSNCNDSFHDRQIDRKIEERESQTRERAHESSARFEKPPVGEAPPNVPPSAAAVPSWLAAWKVVERVTDKTGMLGHPGRHQEWLQQLAAAAEREVTCQTSYSFPEATERLVRAWMADPWVIKNDADIGNMGVWLRKRKPPTTKPIVPARLRDRSLTDAELLAVDEFEECELDSWQKQRRWELQARRDSADSRKLRSIVGGAS